MVTLLRVLRLSLACLVALTAVTSVARASDLSVYAAASLGGVLEEVAALWADETGGRLTPVLAGSSAIARQVQAGAPADLVILANPGWMDALDASGDLRAGTRTDYLTNRLVLIGTDTGSMPLDISDRAAVLARLSGARIALALTDAVPAGIYARAALEHLGLWDAVAPQVVQADNVRAALALVAVGAAGYGIVYATDARAEPRVHVLASLPADSHPPIIYPMAQVAGRDAALTARAQAFFRTAPVRAVFEAHGFGLLDPGARDD